ncbi:MAG TPA: metallophosphoesterase [Anaerolineales bacterium]|nr:metallophosphoesterase [Anaerolineae bacterium]HIQ02327.1 metallophosphoesterase [Anaerolineales bacterium]
MEDHPPDYRPNFVHQAIILAGLLSRVPPLLISPALAGMGAIGAWPWGQPPLQVAAGALTLLTIVGDGVSLALLPRRGRSYGPITPPLVALAVVRAALTFTLGALWPLWSALGLAAVLQLAITAAHLYATWIEPFHLKVTRVELASSKLQSASPLRVLHVSDIHFEGWTPRDRRLLETARELAPDLILITGDYLSLSSVEDPVTHDGVRDLLASLAAVAPTYAITGSPPVDPPHVVPAIFTGLPITWLLDEMVDLRVKGHRLRLVGLRCARDRRRDGARLRRLLPEGAGELFTILLYHSPDLMPDAVEVGVDLYLAGHTHGGQICLPLFGALFTSSDFWKRYEAGLYREGPTTLYVSRGLGVEGLGAPRARFLAPPELVLVTLCPTVA